MAQKPVKIKLFRWDTGYPWGFKMNGGSEYAQPLYVQTVAKGGICDRSGLRPGDVILKINNQDARDMEYTTAKSVILRSGNDVIFIVQHEAVDVSKLHPDLAIGRTDHVLDDREKRYRGYPADAEQPAETPTKSRAFRCLQQQLGEH